MVPSVGLNQRALGSFRLGKDWGALDSLTMKKMVQSFVARQICEKGMLRRAAEGSPHWRRAWQRAT